MNTNITSHVSTSTHVDSHLDCNQQLQTFLQEHPHFQELAQSPTLEEFLKPALQWNPDKTAFPEQELHRAVLQKTIARVHGEHIATQAISELAHSNIIHTAPHLHIPRVCDRPTTPEERGMNPIVSQGEILYAAMKHIHGSQIALTLSTGKVNFDNVNSAKSIQFPSGPMINLVSNKHGSTPQMLAPALDEQTLNQKASDITVLEQKNFISKDEALMGMNIIHAMREATLNIHHCTFADQVARAHSETMNSILDEDITQVTLESEIIGQELVLELLKDSESILSRLLDNHGIEFIQTLSGIDTGWDSAKGENPFFKSTTNKKGLPRLETHTGEIQRKSLIVELETGQTIPRVLTSFIAHMLSGGTLLIGGLNQCRYLVDARDKLIPILHKMGEKKRAEVLQTMPLHIMAMTPCIGVSRNKALLTIPELCAQNKKLNGEDLYKITQISGADSLKLALPTLTQERSGSQKIEHITQHIHSQILSI